MTGNALIIAHADSRLRIVTGNTKPESLVEQFILFRIRVVFPVFPKAAGKLWVLFPGSGFQSFLDSRAYSPWPGLSAMSVRIIHPVLKPTRLP
jgi:hypothetical protein